MSDWIKLNVGGTPFYTTRTTLLSEPDSMLARMFSEETKNVLMPCQMENDTYLIDRFLKHYNTDQILNVFTGALLVWFPCNHPQLFL